MLHEFSPIPGVVEDVTDIILNLKQIPLKLHGEDTKTLSIDVPRPGDVTAGHMTEDPQIEILEPDAHIATRHEEGGSSSRRRSSAAAATSRPTRTSTSHRHRLDPDRLGPLAGRR